MDFPPGGGTPQCHDVDGPPPIQWYYAIAGQQHGPVASADWEALVASGTITEETLVWHEGLPKWMPWGSIQDVNASAPPVLFGDAVNPLATGDVRCSECGRAFPEEDTFGHGHRRICAACKPSFLQRLSEGAPLGQAGGRQLTLEEISNRDYPLGIGHTLSRGWAVFQTEPWMLMAAFLAFSVITAGAMLIGGVVGLVIPFASNLVGLFITSQFTAGLYLICLLRIRGEPVQLQAGLRGFGPRYWQLTLVQLVQSGVLLGFGLLLAAALLPVILMGVGSSLGQFTPPLWAVAVLFALGTVVAVGAVIALFYFLISWMFAPVLVLDKGLNFWPAMKLSRKVVNRHPWRYSLVILVVTTLGLLGFLACGIGVIFTGTLTWVMLATVYEDMFGDLDPRSSGQSR